VYKNYYLNNGQIFEVALVSIVLDSSSSYGETIFELCVLNTLSSFNQNMQHH